MTKVVIVASNKIKNTFTLFYIIKLNIPGDALSLLLDCTILKFERYIKTLISKNKNRMAKNYFQASI